MCGCWQDKQMLLMWLFSSLFVTGMESSRIHLSYPFLYELQEPGGSEFVGGQNSVAALLFVSPLWNPWLINTFIQNEPVIRDW